MSSSGKMTPSPLASGAPGRLFSMPSVGPVHASLPEPVAAMLLRPVARWSSLTSQAPSPTMPGPLTYHRYVTTLPLLLSAATEPRCDSLAQPWRTPEQCDGTAPWRRVVSVRGCCGLHSITCWISRWAGDLRAKATLPCHMEGVVSDTPC